MTPSPFEFKVVVAGPFGVGKTTLINNVSNVSVIGTEVPTSGDEAAHKESTTVGLEYGLLAVGTSEFEINLLLYGTPGQQRFRFMLDVVSLGADGIIVLVDATRPETWDEAAEILSYYEKHHAGACVIGANRTDVLSDSYRRLVERLNVDRSVPIVACQVTNERSARELMVALVELLMHAAGDDPILETKVPGDNGHSTDQDDACVGAQQADRSHWALTGGD